MKKKIHILCNDGSPLRVTSQSIWGEDGRLGVGGAELALLTMCEGLHNRGYDITLYNNPDRSDASPFQQKPIISFDPKEERDYLIVFRSPNDLIYKAKGKKIWWSCDQYTVGDFKAFSKHVDKICVISKFHADYFKDMYGIEDSVVIDLPVRVNDYMVDVDRVEKKCIYTSIPDRGVMQLHAAWARIVAQVPEASLVLTSDWRLWDSDTDRSCVAPYQLSYAMLPKTSYLGAVSRTKLIQHQLSADLLLYPCTYDELFCIAVAEAQAAGAVPVTSQYGALKTTNEFGIQIKGNPYQPEFVDEFVYQTVSLLKDPDLVDKKIYTKIKARERFSLDRILQEWEDKLL